VLAIDAGERRVGLAISDELRMLARPLAVLDRRQGLTGVLDAIAALSTREGVVQVIVGLPLNADGSAGSQARRAEHFAQLVARVSGVPVSMWDERLTTVEAEAVLRAQGRSVRKARAAGQVDAIAAAVILQDYLDATRDARDGG
jgi:putative Holliday junction resolvase